MGKHHGLSLVGLTVALGVGLSAVAVAQQSRVTLSPDALRRTFGDRPIRALDAATVELDLTRPVVLDPDTLLASKTGTRPDEIVVLDKNLLRLPYTIARPRPTGVDEALPMLDLVVERVGGELHFDSATRAFVGTLLIGGVDPLTIPCIRRSRLSG